MPVEYSDIFKHVFKHSKVHLGSAKYVRGGAPPNLLERIPLHTGSSSELEDKGTVPLTHRHSA